MLPCRVPVYGSCEAKQFSIASSAKLNFGSWALAASQAGSQPEQVTLPAVPLPVWLNV